MADDKTKTDARELSRVAGGQDYEVTHLAKYYDISIEQARNLVDKFGNNKQVLDREEHREPDPLSGTRSTDPVVAEADGSRGGRRSAARQGLALRAEI